MINELEVSHYYIKEEGQKVGLKPNYKDKKCKAGN